MKRFTLLLTVVFISIAAFGQSHYIDPQDYEKLKQHNLLEDQQTSGFDGFSFDDSLNEMAQREATRVEINEQDSPKFIEGTPSYAKAIECPEDATYSNPPVNFTSGVTSNTDAGLLSAQKIEGFDDPIQAIRFYGIQAIFTGAWTPMNDVDPYDFEISFYEDNSGLPGTLISSIDATLNHVNTDELFAGVYNVYHWDFVPSSPVDGLPSTFWVGVANTNTNAWFLWIDQPGGPGAAAQSDSGVWALTTYDSFGICLVPVLAEDDAPAAVADLVAIPGADGALEATLTWTNPSTQFNGDALTELTEVNVYRDGVLIHTVASPTIGGAETYADNDISSAGTYSYSVQGVNTAGDGPAAAVSVYIGEDVPAAPGGITLVADGNDGFVTWTAPTEGLNGGYISGTDLTYTVVRMPGSVQVAEDIAATEFLDTTVPGIGNYFYTVTASNDIGVGGTGESNIALLGAEGILMYETFDYPTGAIPPGWEITGVAHAWSVVNTANAGGTAPELRMNWSPASTGLSRLVTYPVDVEDFTELRLKFMQYLNNFSTNEGEIAAIDVSFDGGETWDALWEIVIEDNVPEGLYELYVDVPPGKSTLHFGFRFEGDSYNINQWYIDDMILEPVLDNDLAAVSIEGPVVAPVGVESLYTIQVQNAGTVTQDNYTIKLMGEGDVELASVAGTTIEFTEILSFELPWTPVTEDAGNTIVYGLVEFVDDEATANNQTENFDVFVQPENDLVALSIAGNTTPSVGTESNYTIAVFNAGPVTQSVYEVKLFAEGDVELASLAGTTIEMNDTIFFQLPWTPEPDDEGPMVIYGYVDFEGDELPDNNQTSNLNLVVQPGDVLSVTIGDGEVLTTQPYNFVWDYSIQQTLYYPEEIGLGGGVITGIQYVNSFNETKLDKNIMIWIGETDLEDLAGGWVDPSTLQLVFEGQVDFPEGVNNIFIPLDEFYVYGGGNLVIYNYKMDDEWSGSKNFFNTLDPESNRTRGAQQDGTAYDPANPPAGTARSNFPNITMFFSTAGLGALEGTVTDGTDPLEGVLVSVLGTSSSRVTDENGFYEFSALLPDTYNLEFSKFGYETVVIEGVVVEEEVTTVQDAVVPVLDQFTVSGVVEGNDGALIEDAQITMVGYDNYAAVTDASGAFTIANVYGGTYEVTVMAPGYEVFVDEAVVVDADTDLGTIEVVEILYPPYGLTIETEGMEPGAALFTWNEIFEREFRYDDGTATGQLGSGGGTLNTVLGSAHRNDAVLYEMSWWTTAEGGPHNTVKVWVFGLDESGNPDTQNVLYEMGGVANVDGQWNTYEFPEPVEAPNGFLIGLSYAGFLAIGTDAGTSTEWPFMPNSNFFVGDYTTGAFAAIEGLGDFPFNFLIRAFGADNGELDLKSGYADHTEGQNSDLIYSQLDKPEFTGYPQYSKPVMPADKVFTGFNVYLNDMDNPLITNHQTTSHMFTGLPGGSHTAGVQSVYTTGASEIMTIDFEVEGPEYARVQVIHNSADAAVASVDVYENGELVQEGFGFRQATPFMDLVAGVTLELHFAPAGAGFENAVGPFEVMFTPGETYVVVANGIVSESGYDPAEPFGLFVFDQGQEAAGSGANTDLLVFHGATDAPEVSVWAMGVDNALFAFEYGEFVGYLPLPTNDYVIEIRDASGATTIVAYEAPLATLELDGEALVVVASGFLNPDNNSGGPGFGLWVATAAGGDLIELPVYVSVQDITMGQGNISMFPNPSTDMVNLQSTSTMQEVRVVDISGRVVYTQAIDADQHQINVRQFESGIYFVQVLTAEGTFIGKLQIQK